MLAFTEGVTALREQPRENHGFGEKSRWYDPPLDFDRDFCDDLCMTKNLLSLPIRELARLCAATAYSTDTTPDLDAYFRAELMIDADATIDSRDALIDALDCDIRDMLHNCNLDMLFPANDIDALSDHDRDDFDSHDALADRILNCDEFAAMIADAILDNRSLNLK